MGEQEDEEVDRMPEQKGEQPLNPSSGDETGGSVEPEGGTPPGDASQSPAVKAERAFQHHHNLRRWTLLRGRRRAHFARAAVVGLAAGLMAVLFQWSLFAAEEFRTDLLAWLKLYPLWGWLVLPIVGAAMAGTAGWLVSEYAPETSGSGIPHVKAVLLHLRPLQWGRVIVTKFLGGVLGIGGGLSLGREGPTVQMGAAAGQAIGQLLRAPHRAYHHLIACGAGAGLAASFNAPLAGFIFVIEELQRELSPLTYGTALVAAVSADMITRAFTGQLPSFRISGYSTPSLLALPIFAVVGLLTGLLGVAFNRCLLASVRLSQSLSSVPTWVRTAAVGAAAGLITWWLPQAVGGGHRTAEAILGGDYASADHLGFVVALFATKFLLTMASYGSGAPGGVFAPLLVLGALIGLFVGQVAWIVFPSLAHTPAAFAVAGMAAYFAAIVRAPLTGIVLIVEMTGNYQQLFAVLVTCLVAYTVAETLRDKPVYESLLENDLRRSHKDTHHEEEPILVDVAVEPGSLMDGRRVRDLGLPPGCLLVTIERGGVDFVPGGDTRLQPGDAVTVIVAGDIPHAIGQLEAGARTFRWPSTPPEGAD